MSQLILKLIHFPAVDKALQYLDKDELPPHWDRDVIFGLEEVSTASDSDAAFESDSSDDEPREEKDHFVAQLYKFMDDRGTPINRGPVISGRDVDLYKLFKVSSSSHKFLTFMFPFSLSLST